MPLDWSSAYAAMHAKGEAFFPPACLHYVLEGVLEAHKAARESFPADAADGSLTPDQIVTTFRTRARRDFGPLLPEVLGDWGMTSPAALGEAVLLLGRFGLLSLSPSDTPEAFAADARPLTPTVRGQVERAATARADTEEGEA